MGEELWNSKKVAEVLKLQDANVATGTMRRLKVKVIGREPGRGGLNVYRAEDVLAAKAKAKGRGWHGGDGGHSSRKRKGEGKSP